MKYTDKLGLPIWNKPETDVFDIKEFNKGNQAIDDIVTKMVEQINGLVIGDTKVDLNEYVKEEVLKKYVKELDTIKNNYISIHINKDDTQRDIIDKITLLKEQGCGKLIFPRGGEFKITPSVSGGLAFNEMTNFEIEGNGAKIYCDPYLINNDNNTSKRMIVIKNCKNFKISGLHLLLQIDWNSTTPTNLTARYDTIMDITSTSSSLYSEDFEISNCKFEFNGKFLHDPLNGNNSRVAGLLIQTETNQSPNRYTRNFKVLHNTFKNMIGRSCYLLLSREGVVQGNIFEEMGRYITPDGSIKQNVECKGVRVLGSKNIVVDSNVLNGYSGEVLNRNDDYGSIDFLVCNRGTDDGKSNDVVFSNNIIHIGNCQGTGITIGYSNNTTVCNNQIIDSDDNTLKTIGLSFATDVSSNVNVNNNLFDKVKIMVDNSHGNINNYCNLSMNTHIRSGNHLSQFVNCDNGRVNIINGFYSDKGDYLCEGITRQRRILAKTPPTTPSTFTKGDICINTSYNRDTNPVIEWVYTNDSKGSAVWLPSKIQPIKSSSLPTISGTGNLYTGIIAIYTGGGKTTGELCHFNGTKWVKYDGSVIE